MKDKDNHLEDECSVMLFICTRKLAGLMDGKIVCDVEDKQSRMQAFKLSVHPEFT